MNTQKQSGVLGFMLLSHPLYQWSTGSEVTRFTPMQLKGILCMEYWMTDTGFSMDNVDILTIKTTKATVIEANVMLT